jgi:hypothetical protein
MYYIVIKKLFPTIKFEITVLSDSQDIAIIATFHFLKVNAVSVGYNLTIALRTHVFVHA